MKKILLITLTCLLGNLTFSQTSVLTTVTKKVAILEEYTGIYCTWCPAGHKVANEIAAANLGKFYSINIHQGAFANQQGSDPDFKTPWGDALAAQAKVEQPGYPSGSMNRRNFTNTATSPSAKARDYWNSNSAIVIAENSPVNIAAKASLNASTRLLTVSVELYYTDPTAAANSNTQNYLNIALLQDNILGPQTGSSKNPSQVVASKYKHNHVLRTLITGQWGETVAVKAGFAAVTKTYTVPNDYNGVAVKLDDLSIIAFISKEQKENIFTGTKERVKVTLSTGNLFSENTLFNVFPNPASNQVTLSLTQGGNNNPVAVKIFDITGRSVFKSNTTTEKLKNYKINTQEFAQGVYFVEISSENHNKITKLIIQ